MSLQPHATGETCALALCVTVPAGHGSSLHLHTRFATVTWSQDSALRRTQGLCVPPGGPTGLSQAGRGPGLLLAMAGCHSIASVLGPDEVGAWGGSYLSPGTGEVPGSDMEMRCPVKLRGRFGPWCITGGGLGPSVFPCRDVKRMETEAAAACDDLSQPC